VVVNEYSQLLEQVADRALPTGLPGPAAIRRAGERRRRNTLALGAAGAIAVLGVGVAIVVGAQTSAPRPVEPLAPTSPAGSPSADSATDPGSPYGERVTVEPGLDHFDPSAVAYFDAAAGDGVYVVVGDTGGTFTGPRTTPPIWWSTDARDWRHAGTGPAVPNVWDVTSFDGGLIAIATRGTAWWSTDGDRWVRASVPEGFRAYSLSSTSAGLFAWDDAAVFTSSAGQEWAETAALPGLDGGRICFVMEDAGSIVLGAITAQDEPAAWVLEDGDWQSRPVPASGASDWCRRQETAHWSVRGSAGTVTVRPYDSYFNTVFVKDD
jgi:hypothetical protein